MVLSSSTFYEMDHQDKKPMNFSQILIPSVSIKLDPDSYPYAGDDDINDSAVSPASSRHSDVENGFNRRPPLQQKRINKKQQIKKLIKLEKPSRPPKLSKCEQEKKDVPPPQPPPFMSSQKVKIFASFGHCGQYECGHCLDADQKSPPLKTRRQIMNHFKTGHNYELKTACPLCQKCKFVSFLEM